MIEHKAEERILKDLRILADTNPQHRCLYIRFSQIGLEKNIWLPVLTEILKGRFFEEVSQIYVFHDNDVFILGRSWTQKRLEQFLTHLTQKLSPALLHDELASLFEVGIHWHRLQTLCTRKIQNLAILKEKEQIRKKEILPAIDVNQTVSSLSSELISTIATRREKRKNIEIMIVEDDLFSQKLVFSALAGQYSLTMTGDGQGAVMIYVNKAPDVLFLDIGLPDIDGHAVLKKLFEIDPQAYVVMFSGNGDKENILKAIQLGAKGFIGKPFTREKLHQYLEKSPFVQTKLTNKEIA